MRYIEGICMKMCNYAIKIMILLLYISPVASKDEVVWSWQYRKKVTPEEGLLGKKNKEVIFVQKDAPHFTQLIFSWNSLRPFMGHFTFYVSVKVAERNTWSNWHQMMQWGSAIQRSFRVQHTDGNRYEHVRFEVDNGKADGFRIKVVAQDTADIHLLKELHVNIADFSLFKKESLHDLLQLHTVMVKDVPRISQRELDHPRSAGLCSPTACSMLVSYITKKEINPIQFAEGVFDQGLDIYGSWPFNMAHAYEHAEGKASFAASRLNSFKELHKMLIAGLPVVVSVRGDLMGAPKSYDQGHLLVVIGWDARDKSVLCYDPAFETKDTIVAKYPLESFLGAWERSRRLSYIAKPHSF